MATHRAIAGRPFAVPQLGHSGLSVVPSRGDRLRPRRAVKWNRFPSQALFDEMDVLCKGFSGPIGSGKSKALVHEAIKLAHINPGVLGLIGSPTYRLLTDSTLVELLNTLDEQEIPHKFHKSSFSVRLHEPGTTILLRSLEEPERLRAMNLGWFGIDELSYCKEAAWTRLEGRLRHPLAKTKRKFGVWTPKGRDWVWRRFISSRAIDGYHCVMARPYENRAILDVAPDFYSNLEKSYDEKFFRQEVLGEYVDMGSGAVYHSFRAEENVRSCDYDPRLPLIWTLDFNLNPMTSVLAQQQEFYGHKTVNVLREIILPGSNVPEMCRAFVRRTEDWQGALNRPLDVRVYGDAAGGGGHASTGDSSWTVLKRVMQTYSDRYDCKYLYDRKNPEQFDRVTAVNGMLCSFAAPGRDYSGKLESGARKLFVDPSCKELIQDFEDVNWKVDAHGNSFYELDKRDPKRTHISDALGYYIWVEFGLKGKVRISAKSGF